LLRLLRAAEAIEGRDCRCCGLTRGQALALLALKPGKCVPMQVVAKSLGVTPGTATRVVDNLVRDGLARRGDDPEDRRCVCGCVTARGNTRLIKLEKGYARLRKRTFGGMSRARLAGATKLLGSLADCLVKADREWGNKPGTRRGSARRGGKHG
jgi:DNA-binding MarR family transcriptional regulator